MRRRHHCIYRFLRWCWRKRRGEHVYSSVSFVCKLWMPFDHGLDHFAMAVVVVAVVVVVTTVVLVQTTHPVMMGADRLDLLLVALPSFRDGEVLFGFHLPH